MENNNAIKSGGWVKRAVCVCGETYPAPFANLFFVKSECCPECGEDKNKMIIKTVRYISAKRSGPWWNRKIISPGYWEIKDSPSRFALSISETLVLAITALDAIHYYIDASDSELSEVGITRTAALCKARKLREDFLRHIDKL